MRWRGWSRRWSIVKLEVELTEDEEGGQLSSILMSMTFFMLLKTKLCSIQYVQHVIHFIRVISMHGYLKISNFKCFGETPQGFDTVKPINLLLGRNNSGKSSLIDVLQGSIEGAKVFPAITRRGNKNPQIHFAHKLTEEQL